MKTLRILSTICFLFTAMVSFAQLAPESKKQRDKAQPAKPLIKEKEGIEITLDSLNECISYDPSQDSGSLSGTWEDPFDEDEYVFNVPNDLGGGYVEVIHSSPTPIIPAMFSNVNPVISGTISGGSAAQTKNERARHDVFEAAPGQSYHVRVSQFFKARLEDYPLGYSGGWTFHSRVDCYEPNNTIMEAKLIPINQVIEAYSIAGYIKSGIRNRDTLTLDWYRFNLKKRAKVKIELLQVAKDQQINLRLFNKDENVYFSVSALKGELLIKKTGFLNPGTWFLEVHPVHDRRTANLLIGQTIPDHFNTPYKFIVNIK